MTIYAVGDIHGHRALLDDVIARIDRDGGTKAEVVFIGDYIDRGPDSRGVIETLIRGQQEGRRWTCLLGNHDRMFGNFLDSGTISHPSIKSGLGWTHDRLGGLETLASYGLDAGAGRDILALWSEAAEAVPQAHRDFLGSCPLFAERDGLLFVHAGIRPGVALADQLEEDLIWIRDDFLMHRAAHDWMVVHGHTAVQGADHRGNRVNLDGGAGYGRPLRVAAFEAGEVFELTPQGREKLTPGSWGAAPDWAA
ncbi:metallophosphoesterase family protein [Pseudooceanicola sp.]|uniref:metallophosphoesterase family protein n=1 Tax=Pseudooceanicola sp. TaxID=1914328 RepID=UPI0035C68187